MNKHPNGKSPQNDPERGLFEKLPDIGALHKKQAGPAIEMVPVQMPAYIVRQVNDGFSNPAAGTGLSSILASSGQFVRTEWTLEELTTLYMECSIAKRIIDMKSEEMTRAWYTLSSPELTEKDQSLMKALEARHSIKQEITNGIRWGRLYGGALAAIVIAGHDGRMDEPLDPTTLSSGCFMGLYITDLTQGITPSLEIEDNLSDPDFGYPKYYDIQMDGAETGILRVHHSRVLRFTGRELPHAERIRHNHWGVSELIHPMDELQRYLNVCDNINQLVFQANLVTLKMGSFGSDLAYGSDRTRQAVQQTIEDENRLRTSFGVQVMNAGDSMETHPYNFSGVTEIKESFMLDVAGAAEMPATFLFGRSPQGMNATGEADIRIYYDKIAQEQERILRPALEKLLPVMAVSCWGFIPDDMKITFNPVMTMSPAEIARTSKLMTEDVVLAVESGMITRDEGRAEMNRRGTVLNTWGSLT